MSQRRGQATAEFALGLLVFLTVLLFGIHFAELGYLSTKLQEAQASALWDSTAFRSYQFGAWADSSRISAPGAQTSGVTRYRDWDGRTSANGGAPTLALSRAEPMQLDCRRAGGVRYPLGWLAPDFGEAGGVSCATTGDVTAFRVPTAFAEGARGFFKAAHNTHAANPMQLCGSGRPSGGNCPGRLALLLGDFALTDQSEASECPLATGSPSSCSNGRFYSTTRATFDKSMQLTAGWAEGWTGRPERWTRNIVPGLPGGRITGFYLSFRGEEAGTNFTEPVETSLGGGSWQTNPMDAQLGSPPAPQRPYRNAYTQRRTCQAAAGYCFLGRFPCN